jgi:fatty-acid peroxygenase
VFRRDRTLDILVKGYPAISQMRAAASRYEGLSETGVADGVEVSLLGGKTLCVGGPAGVRLFYDETLTTRSGALPGPVRSVLFGDGAVHGLDGGAHRQRKALFLSLLGPKAAEDLALIADRRWQVAVRRWQSDGKPMLLFDEAVGVLGSAVCEWAGVPPDRQGPGQYRDLATIVDGFGSVGLRHLAARRARCRADRWAAQLIDDTRSVQIETPESAALASIAGWSDENGNPLDTSVAAVELLNVLRPATAVSWFVVFAALALENHPDWRAGLQDAGEPEVFQAFVHEVRRMYPFAPMLAARARMPFDWGGHHVAVGQRLVLDLFGTLHDETAWPEPERFAPDRFMGTAAAAAFSDAYVPHGGGDPVDGHRCPGEPATLALLEGAIRMLVSISYRLEDPRRLRLKRMPARAHVVLTDIGITQQGRQSSGSAVAL